MIRRITWKLMSKHVDGLDEEMVEELHQLFLRMKMPGGYWHQGRDIVGEEIHGCGVPEYVERTFTLDGLVNMAVAKLTLDGGLALECVLNSLLEKDGTPEERKKVGSISAKIIERDNGKPHRRESAKYDFAGATIEKLYVESTVNEYNYGHENQGGISNVDEIPAELMTEEAQPLWKKLRDAGFIVADGYALADGVSNNQAAYIADRMSEKLKIKNKWKVFQQLWNIENMAQLAGSWKQTGKLPPKTDEIDEIME